jgi:Putative polyhydroxyalkanoic acid system protein (PHA_gran_rgn)
MSGLIVTVTHRLSQNEALRRIQVEVAQAKAQYSHKINDLRESWNGYFGTFLVSAMNQQASATVAVNPSGVTVQITLPLLALGFKPVVESRIRDMLVRILA